MRTPKVRAFLVHAAQMRRFCCVIYDSPPITSIDDTRKACSHRSSQAPQDTQEVSFIDKRYYFFRQLIRKLARTVQVGRSNAEEEARNDQETEARGDCPLSRPTGKARGEVDDQPPACGRRDRAQA